MLPRGGEARRRYRLPFRRLRSDPDLASSIRGARGFFDFRLEFCNFTARRQKENPQIAILAIKMPGTT